ncbi:MAG: ATP-dependent DNA helicase [Hadesarchaea archaeon]|nr:ATP-dependent DNA helicase [Hadesarchaea archaeon]
MHDLFPYSYRENQEEVIDRIQEEIGKSNICFHAATGYGKTPVILASLLPYADDNRIIWTVRTGNETDRPIEELKIINEASGSNFFGLSYRGKRDMCLLAKETDMGGRPSYSDVSFLCREQGMDCPYRRNLEDINPEDLAEDPLLYSELLELSKNKEICPYYAQRELLPLADVVSLSYNYVVSRQLSWSIRKSVPFSKSFLVVDEAHNIQQACSSLNSDQITLRTLERSYSELEKFEEDEDVGGLMDLVQLIKLELEVMSEDIEDETEFDMDEFFQNLVAESGESPENLEVNFERMVTYGTKIRRKQLEEGKKPRSSLHHLGRFWNRVLDSLNVNGVAFLAKHERDTLVIEVWDMRSAEILRKQWRDFKSCIFCSGTLKPIRAFATTAGLNKAKSIDIGSFYNPQKIISFISDGLTTKGKTLGEEMANRYVDSIVDFAKEINSNVAAFSSSYRIQRRLLEAGLKERIEDAGIPFYQEEQGMDGTRARKILDDFKLHGQNNGSAFLCATAKGRFAEGTDFPGEELEGIFMVGIPFDRMNTRTEIYLDYYRDLYGKKKGVYYGYIVPALQRASQALGRALRSKEDKGVFICGDQRYGDRRFFRLLPEYIKNNSRSTKYNRIDKDIRVWLEKISQ